MQHPRGYPTGTLIPLDADALPLVRVTGEGRLEVGPDTAEVSLGASVRAAQATVAYEQTAAALSRIVGSMLDMGVPREQIQTDQILLAPIYEQEQLVGYQGSGTLRVQLRDLAAVGPIIDRAVQAGATRVHGVTFRVKDPGAYEAAALAAAVHDAQRKAALLARSLGIRLGPVWRIETDSFPGPIIPAFVRAAPAEGLPVLPGTLPVVRSVRVDYIIG